jgi:HEAT repeat protein
MEGVLPILAELSKDEDPQVRKAALSSLHSLYPEESEDRMLEAMTDRDPHLRKWAKEVLEKIVASPLRTAVAYQHREGKDV